MKTSWARGFLLIVVFLLLPHFAFALSTDDAGIYAVSSIEQDASPLDGPGDSGAVYAISPVYSQLLRFSLPPGFETEFEHNDGSHYVREAVRRGETVDHWTEMVTVTGERNFALQPLTPKAFAEGMAGGFRRACPDSFNARTLGDGKISGFDAYVGVASCGISPMTQGQTSETALIVVIKGQNDFYTLQWAERSAKSATPPDIDMKKWDERFHRLAPIRLCAIVPGEKAPYRSCLN